MLRLLRQKKSTMSPKPGVPMQAAATLEHLLQRELEEQQEAVAELRCGDILTRT